MLKGSFILWTVLYVCKSVYSYCLFIHGVTGLPSIVFNGDCIYVERQFYFLDRVVCLQKCLFVLFMHGVMGLSSIVCIL